MKVKNSDCKGHITVFSAFSRVLSVSYINTATTPLQAKNFNRFVPSTASTGPHPPNREKSLFAPRHHFFGKSIPLQSPEDLVIASVFLQSKINSLA